MKKCPHCGEEIQEQAQKCRFCGSWLNETQQVAQTTQQNIQTDKSDSTEKEKNTNCPYCGEEILSTAKKCKHCGEWLNDITQEKVHEKKQTKHCPYCGEEILCTAIKCKHCGENIFDTYKEIVNFPKDKISTLNVSENWKKIFRNLDKIYIDGNVFKGNPSFTKLPYNERRKLILSSRPSLGSLFAAGFWGPFYYLVKGMWLKAIVYTVIILGITALIENFIEIPNRVYLVFCTFWIANLSCDYYRYKVLGKQW